MWCENHPSCTSLPRPLNSSYEDSTVVKEEARTRLHLCFSLPLGDRGTERRGSVYTYMGFRK